MDQRKVHTDRVMGALLGLVLGDTFGAPYEGGIPERLAWALIGKTKGRKRWTDDTQMTINVVESIIACGGIDQDDLACRFSESYRWSRGYGPGAARMLKKIRRGMAWKEASRSVYKDGSFGNGGAMRSPAVGLYFAHSSEEGLVTGVRQVAEITHVHPLGIEGAVLIGLATSLVLQGVSNQEVLDCLSAQVDFDEFSSRLETVGSWLEYEEVVSPRLVARELGNGIAAMKSCVTAIYLALAFRDKNYEELLGYTIKVGGDVDTIAAMASAIWGAVNGAKALPEEMLEQVEDVDRLRELFEKFALLF